MATHTNKKLTVCVDLDGVLNQYTGYKGTDDWPEPRPGAFEFMADLCNRYKVVVFSTRNPIRVAGWLQEHAIPFDDATNIKPSAIAYIDDRAIQFRGDFRKTYEEVLYFRPYWDRD